MSLCQHCILRKMHLPSQYFRISPLYFVLNSFRKCSTAGVIMDTLSVFIKVTFFSRLKSCKPCRFDFLMVHWSWGGGKWTKSNLVVLCSNSLVFQWAVTSKKPQCVWDDYASHVMATFSLMLSTMLLICGFILRYSSSITPIWVLLLIGRICFFKQWIMHLIALCSSRLNECFASTIKCTNADLAVSSISALKNLVFESPLEH